MTITKTRIFTELRDDPCGSANYVKIHEVREIRENVCNCVKLREHEWKCVKYKRSVNVRETHEDMEFREIGKM